MIRNLIEGHKIITAIRPPTMLIRTTRRAFFTITLGALCFVTLIGCEPLNREPSLARDGTKTPSPPTPSPTPTPVIEIESLTIQSGEDDNRWEIFGLLRNISSDGIADLELNIAVVDTDGTALEEDIFTPALRHIPPGDLSPFHTELLNVEGKVGLDQVYIEPSSFQSATVRPLRIAVHQVSKRPNYEGGTTYLGYFSNVQPEYAQILNVSAFIVDKDGLPIDSADSISTISSIAPRDRIPFTVEYHGDQYNQWPEIYIDAIPDQGNSRQAMLWSISEPQLFFTDQKIPYYLVELKNSAFAPQVFAGIFTLIEGDELVGLMPVHSPAPVPAQSSWFFTLEPNLALPTRLRNESAVRDLSVNLITDPLATHGVSQELVIVDLEIQAVESIGGSIYLKGSLSNPSDQSLSSPVVYAILRDTSGNAITANTNLVSDSLPERTDLDFTIALRLPSGTDPASLEFDVTAIALTRPDPGR